MLSSAWIYGGCDQQVCQNGVPKSLRMRQNSRAAGQMPYLSEICNSNAKDMTEKNPTGTTHFPSGIFLLLKLHVRGTQASTERIQHME